MRYSRNSRARRGAGHALPWVTLEFLGSVNSTITCPRNCPTGCASVHPRLWLDVLHIVGHGVGVHRPVVDLYFAGGEIEPRKRVLHPVLVVAGWEVLACVGAAAFGTVG